MPFKILHCGCGNQELPERLASLPDIQEIRLDINPSCRPDICASMTHIPLEPMAVDCIYTAHTIEHLYAHHVDRAINEFFRVLTIGGQCLIICPDLESICKYVLDGKLEETVYHCAAGPITAAMMLFGYTPDIARGNPWMAHHYGFTAKSLGDKLHRAGFYSVQVARHDDKNELEALAVKGDAVYDTTY